MKNPTSDFGVLVGSITGGDLLKELSETNKTVLTTLEDHARDTCGTAGGTLTLVLKYKVERNGAVRIEADVATKLPKLLRAADHFFTNGKGALSRKDPRQQELPLREVGGATEIKEAKSS